MKWMKWALAVLAAAAIPAAAQSPAQLHPTHPAPVSAAASAPSAEPQASMPAELTKSDLDTWLNGYMPYALKAGGIPGAVVVVVKDGQVLTQRGFGYSDVTAHKPVDPENTLFRPGSVSKLFTWTAVMQLVQAGKIDLDADVNTYLDFKIPHYNGKPVTVRDLMTHRPGFGETVKGLIVFGKKTPEPLGKILKTSIPEQIYAPGEMSAYSNYGASLAGYIVQRVSGEPFEQYIARHIFAPLGMAHSSFQQPLPGNLDPLMSNAYEPGSIKPEPFEVIGMSPAGALSSSGADMAKFMIAHLNNGGPLLAPATAKLMHSTAYKPYSALPGMALGFYHEDRNGLDIVGHGGDTVYFHSDLHLFLDKNVGLYISMNSVGKGAGAHAVRGNLLEAFADRYFPEPEGTIPTTDTAKAHGQAMSGHYVSSRASGFNFLRLAALIGETTASVDDDGYLVVSSITDAAGTPRKWREISPWVWKELNGEDRLQAIPDANGGIKMFSISPYAPIIEFLPAPTSLNAGWILPVAGIALLILAIAALGWPVGAFARWRYSAKQQLAGRDLLLYRATRAAAWLYIVVLVGWFIIFSMLESDLSAFDGSLDIWMRLLQLLLVLALVGTLAAAWNAWKVAAAPGRHILRTVWAVLIALSALFLAWLAINVGLLTPTLNY